MAGSKRADAEPRRRSPACEMPGAAASLATAFEPGVEIGFLLAASAASAGSRPGPVLPGQRPLRGRSSYPLHDRIALHSSAALDCGTIWATDAVGETPQRFDGTPADRLWHDPARATPMRPDILNPLFRPVTSLAGIGPKLGEALRRLLGGADDRRRRGSSTSSSTCRSASSTAAASPASRCRREGAIVTLQGPRRPPPEAAARQPAHPLPGLRPRRHRRDRPHLLPRPRRLAREDAAGRRDPLCQRPDGMVQRPADDGPSRPHRRRGRLRRAAADRAGLPDDRRPVAEDAGPRHRATRSASLPAAARMAGRRRSRRGEQWPAFAAALAARAPSGEAAPTSSRQPAPRAPRLRRAARQPARARPHARSTSGEAPARRGRATAGSARRSSPPCPSR